MKICLISNLYPPCASGGAEIYVERLANALSGKDEVFVVTTRPFAGFASLSAKKELRNKIPVYSFYPLNIFHVHSLNKKNIALLLKIIWRAIDMFNLHSFFVVRNILKKENPDVVHTHNLGGMSFSVFWAAKLTKKRLVHTMHDYHLICPYAGLLMCQYTNFTACKKTPFFCKAYSFFKQIIVDDIPVFVTAPSNFLINIHKQYKFFKKTQFRAIPNFADSGADFTFREKNKSTLDILYVGRLSKPKGIDLLIKTFNTLDKDFLRLHVVGEGDLEEKLLAPVKSNPKIILYGSKNSNELKEIYSSCDVLVIPSVWYENFPNVILEAFSFGLPVIGSRIGGIPEMVKDGYNGFLFEPGDSLALKAAINKFIDDFSGRKILLKKMSENALADSKKYGKDAVVSEFIKLYQLM